MTSRTAHRRARGRDLVDPNPAWSRDRLRLLAGGVVAAAVVVLVGLGLAIGQALDPTRATASAPDPTPAVVKSTTAGTAAVPGAGRDAAAAAPMPAVPGGRAAELPPAVAPAALRLPQPTVLRGPGGVASGFPRTVEGALAQLAAIDELVLTTMQPSTAVEVYQAWAAEGGVPADAWVLTRHVTSFRSTLNRAGTGVTARVTVSPAAGLVKATDGPDWLVGCVLLDVRATVKTEARLGFGHCERLQWDAAAQRWLIAPGTPPAQPGAVTPGTAAAAQVGWRPFTASA